MTHALVKKKQTPEHIANRVAARRKNGTYTPSDETRKLFSAVHTGRKHTDEWKRNASIRMTNSHPMKGKTHSLESRMKMSLSRKGVPRPDLRGENSPGWKGGKTSLMIALRRSVNYRNWREAVYKRDNYTCQLCGEVGGRLNPDHVMPVSQYPEMIFDVLNGRTLCHDCHKQTETYGWKSHKFEPEMKFLIENYGR